jgi:hypothetical protein
MNLCYLIVYNKKARKISAHHIGQRKVLKVWRIRIVGPIFSSPKSWPLKLVQNGFLQNSAMCKHSGVEL